MKHLLNNLTEEEKNSIREQHTGVIEVNTSKFKTLMESSLGNVKPLLNEQETEGEEDIKPYENPRYAEAGFQKVEEINLPDGEYIANPTPEVYRIPDWASLKYVENLFLFTKEKKYTGYILVLKMASRSGEDNQPITISGKKAILGDNEPRCCLSYYFKQPVAQTGTTVNEQVSGDTTTQPTTMDSILNDFIQKGYKDITTWYFSPEGVVYIPDGDYVGNGWGYYENILTKDGKDTGYVFVFNGAVRGERKDIVKVAQDGGAIGSTGGKIYKVLLNDKILDSSGLRKK